MKYIMKSRILYQLPPENTAAKDTIFRQNESVADKSGPEKIAYIKSRSCDPKKEIIADGGQKLIMEALDIKDAPDPFLPRVYRLSDQNGTLMMTGRPLYSDDDNPNIYGWPVCRMPKADRLEICLNSETLMLHMKNNQYYQLADGDGLTLYTMIHKGITGGWDLETFREFTPGILCGLFLFCNYLGKENEFITV